MQPTAVHLPDRRSLAFREEGIGDGVVLLHAIGLAGRSWDALSGHLSPARHVLAPDLPGHGASDPPPPPFSIGGFADDVAELIRSAGRPPVAVVGLSLGGMVALALADRHPDLVASVVVINSVATLPAGLQEAVKGRADRTLVGGMAAVADETMSRWFTPRFVATDSEAIDDVRQLLLDTDPAAHAATWMAMARCDLEPRLSAIHQPVLVVTGAEDQATSPELGERMVRRLPHGEHLCLAGAGHMSPLEEPERLARIIERFLDTTGALAGD